MCSSDLLSEDNFQALGGDFKYQKERQEINWNVQHISASNSCTQDTELRIQKITNLQHIANNLPNPFTGYKYITNPIILQQLCPKEWWYQ